MDQMSYDEQDAAYDQWMDDLYREHRTEAITEFTTGRLQSYYLANPTLAEAPRRVLSDAIRLVQDGFFDAALVFGQIATETSLKAIVLKPFVHGVVHSVSTAEFVSELAVGHTGLDRFRELLFQLLLDHAGLDFRQFKRRGATDTLWTEIKRLQKVRNAVVHRAEAVSVGDANLSIAVASSVLDEVFPALVSGLDLHVHEGVRVCNDHVCKWEGVLSPDLISRLRQQS
ncbi:hypothetical protein C0Q88_25230 [Ralstonia pickettii]|uniref:RiboL-PSP-HEPN domain-containing protein n=1 Tax=Ralstonia pickettii TaxID=329 RepID=A0A2N4TJZ9_RALPI|nr:hypothetical protein [Ralstonia pickettii]PLC40001.1 hypothetical protein C0Q88_25230 [Ralstonia pickettii]